MFIRSLLFSLIILNSLAAWGDRAYQGHSYEVHSVSFSNDGQYLASGSGDTSVIVWDLQSHEPVLTIKDHMKNVYAVAFSKVTPHLLATSSSDGELAIWDVAARTKVKTLAKGDSTGNGIISLDFSRLNNNLAVGFMGGEIEIWNMDTLSLIARSSDRHLGGFALSTKFSPDGKYIYSTGGTDGSVHLYSAADAALLKVFHDPASSAPIWDIAIKRNGEEFFTVNSVGELLAWETGSTEPVKRHKIHDYLAQAIEISKDDKTLYVGVDAFNSEQGNNIKIIDSNSGRILKEIPAHRDRIRGMDLSADGSSLATGSWDFSVKTWDIPISSHED